MRRQEKKYRCVRNHESKLDTGYTYEEAWPVKRELDTANGVEYAHSKWHEAEIVPDPRGGYMVVAKRI